MRLSHSRRSDKEDELQAIFILIFFLLEKAFQETSDLNLFWLCWFGFCQQGDTKMVFEGQRDLLDKCLGEQKGAGGGRESLQTGVQVWQLGRERRKEGIYLTGRVSDCTCGSGFLRVLCSLHRRMLRQAGLLAVGTLQVQEGTVFQGLTVGSCPTLGSEFIEETHEHNQNKDFVVKAPRWETTI